MPRVKRPENKVAEDITDLVSKARDVIGLNGSRGYKKTADDGSVQQIGYRTQFKGTPPYWAYDSETPNKNHDTENKWGAIWLAIGSQGEAELSVLILKKDTNGAVKDTSVVGSVAVSPAKDLVPDRVNEAGELVKDEPPKSAA